MKRMKKHRPLSDEEMAQLKIKPQWWLERQKSMTTTENPRDTQMPQGIICINPISAFKDYFDLTIDPALIDLGKLKEALLLPDRYTVDSVLKPGRYRDSAEIIVSSPDIPEAAEGDALPTVTPCYLNENKDGKARTISLSDILINGISAIKEEDKARKVNMGIKEIAEESSDARDTQFSGFAKLLWDELISSDALRINLKSQSSIRKE